jgi:hypothetical protein
LQEFAIVELMLITILAVISAAELLVWLPPLWRWRRSLAAAVLAGLAIASAALIVSQPALWTGVFGFFSLYRIINLWRLVRDTVQPDYLYSVSRRTAWLLISCQIAVAAMADVSHHLDWITHGWMAAIGLIQIVVSLVLALTTIHNLRLTGYADTEQELSGADLPTLTVAIPARNESEDLQACLESLVASGYPKLEILVLDDCSQNRQTSEIIRSFAHAGVRFISGKVPPVNWLAKNYAYHQLAEAANGEIILFCGVDTRFRSDSLQAMIGIMLARQDSMISWLPRNIPPEPRSSSIIQPNRYAWELALPRLWLKRPPVLSTCWLIRAEQLHASGGFKSISRSASPESYFARQSLGQHSYGFIQSRETIGLTSVKSSAEQRATAIRTRYLQLHRKPELVALASLAELVLIIGAPCTLIAGLLSDNAPAAVLSGLSTIILAATYARIVNLTYRKFRSYGVWIFPLAALYDVALLNYSMWQYEFNQVIWKGRNICLPVMRSRLTAD